jgi:uncharacterized protein YaaW (UPF0174 family)
MAHKLCCRQLLHNNYQQQAHLAAQLAAKDAVHKGGGSQLRRWLGPYVLEEGLMHGIQHAAQVLVRILLPAQAEPATTI